LNSGVSENMPYHMTIKISAIAFCCDYIIEQAILLILVCNDQ